MWFSGKGHSNKTEAGLLEEYGETPCSGETRDCTHCINHGAFEQCVSLQKIRKKL